MNDLAKHCYISVQTHCIRLLPKQISWYKVLQFSECRDDFGSTESECFVVRVGFAAHQFFMFRSWRPRPIQDTCSS